MKSIRILLVAAVLVPGIGLARADTETCLQCHDTVDEAVRRPPSTARRTWRAWTVTPSIRGVTDFPTPEKLRPADCASCHEDVTTDYARSIHAQTSARWERAAPTCASCHGVHDMLPASDPRSPTHKSNESQLCGKCHGMNGLKDQEVHALRLRELLPLRACQTHRSGEPARAASCADCHGTHDLRGSADTESSIHRWRIPRTCGKCHPKVNDEYLAGIGKAFKLGISDSPRANCGEHEITGARHRRIQPPSTGRSASALPRLPHQPGCCASTARGWAPPPSLWIHTTAAGLKLNSPRAATRQLPRIPHDPAQTGIRPPRWRGGVAATSPCHPAPRRVRPQLHSRHGQPGREPAGRFLPDHVLMILAVIGGMVVHNLLILYYFFRRKRTIESRAPRLTRFHAAGDLDASCSPSPSSGWW